VSAARLLTRHVGPQRDVPRPIGLADSAAVRDRTPGGVVDDVDSGVSAFDLRRTRLRAGCYGQETSQENGVRRGSSTVSTRDADGPVSAGGVAGGCSAGERVP